MKYIYWLFGAIGVKTLAKLIYLFGVSIIILIFLVGCGMCIMEREFFAITIIFVIVISWLVLFRSKYKKYFIH